MQWTEATTLHGRLFRIAGFAGLFTMVVAGALLAVLPRHAAALPRGFEQPILAFEFARSAAEVEALFGPAGSPERAELVRAMDSGNRLDFLFMVAYGGYLGLIGLAVAKVAGRGYLVVTALAVLGVLLDVAENLQLLEITSRLGGDYSVALGRLQVFTWLKWGALALGVAWLSPWALAGTWASRVAGALSSAAGVLAVAAYFFRDTFAEVFANMLTFSFLALDVVMFQTSHRLGRSTDGEP
jgi:hypothetical protein